MDFGMANVLAITVLVYLAGMGLKVSKLEDKWIPLLCGTIGLILGLAADARFSRRGPAYRGSRGNGLRPGLNGSASSL